MFGCVGRCDYSLWRLAPLALITAASSVTGWFVSFVGLGAAVNSFTLLFAVCLLHRLDLRRNDDGPSHLWRFLFQAGWKLPAGSLVISYFISLLSVIFPIRYGNTLDYAIIGLLFFPIEVLVFITLAWGRIREFTISDGTSSGGDIGVCLGVSLLVFLIAHTPICGVSHRGRTMADMRAVGETLEAYKRESGVYPTMIGIQKAREILEGKQIKQIPTVDGWHNELWLISSPSHYTLVSWGSDKKPGHIEDQYQSRDIVLCNGDFISEQTTQVEVFDVIKIRPVYH